MDQTGCTLLNCGPAVDSPFWDFSSIGGLIRAGVASVFAIIIIFGIIMVIRAVLKIVRSEGDETKIQEGYSMVRGVYIGIAIIFLGLIGMVIVLAFFNAGSIVGTTPEVPPGLNIPL